MADPTTVLKQILDSSSLLSTSGLAVFGGTVAAVLGTSYRRPTRLCWRLPFLLFLPGWLCLARSLYLGNVIAGRYLAATMVPPSGVADIAARINDDYAGQRNWLLYALCFFAAWLVCYLYFWIFVEPDKETS